MTDIDRSPETHDIGHASPILVIFVLIPLIAILALLLNFANELRTQNLAPADTGNLISPSALLDFEAPYFELPNLNNQVVSVVDYRGKILFLNFWQTTCPPCQRELPDFVSLIGDNADDAAWLAINVDETPEMVNTFFAKYDLLGIPVLMDKDSTVRHQYGVVGFPMTFVIDADGIVRYVNIGELSYPEMRAILEAVRG